MLVVWGCLPCGCLLASVRIWDAHSYCNGDLKCKCDHLYYQTARDKEVRVMSCLGGSNWPLVYLVSSYCSQVNMITTLC